MRNENSYYAVLLGAVVAAVVIGAFMLGYSGVLEPGGPAESVGASIDSAAEDVSEGLKNLGKEIKKAAQGSGN